MVQLFGSKISELMRVVYLQSCSDGSSWVFRIPECCPAMINFVSVLSGWLGSGFRVAGLLARNWLYDAVKRIPVHCSQNNVHGYGHRVSRLTDTELRPRPKLYGRGSDPGPMQSEANGCKAGAEAKRLTPLLNSRTSCHSRRSRAWGQGHQSHL